MLASLLAASVALAMLAAGRWTRQTKIPYGPYLSAGAAIIAVVVAV